MQLTNQMRKDVAALDEARTRRQARLFKAEGQKCVNDTLGHFTLHSLYATAAWAEANDGLVSLAATGWLCDKARSGADESSVDASFRSIAVY